MVASTEAKVLPRERKDDPQPRRLIPAMVRVDGSASDPDNEVDCTDAANTLKDDFVYAADMLVPFIPLHQEAKCEIAPGTGQGQDWWRLLKAAYSVTGWIIFSLALVTFSGVLKRFDRDAA